MSSKKTALLNIFLTLSQVCSVIQIIENILELDKQFKEAGGNSNM